MAGGKGKSSGGKSSAGGKVGADGNKKQQSHSSKAGLQVSIAQLCLLSFVVAIKLCGPLGERRKDAIFLQYLHPTTSRQHSICEQSLGTITNDRDMYRSRRPHIFTYDLISYPKAPWEGIFYAPRTSTRHAYAR